MLLSAIGGSLAVAGILAAIGQVPAAIDDAHRVLSAAADASNKLQSVEYVVESEGFGAKVQALVHQKRSSLPSSGLMEGIYVVTGEVDRGSKGKQTFAYSYDGEAFRACVGQNKTVQLLKRPKPAEIAQVVPMEATLATMPYFRDAFNSSGAKVTAKYLGKTQVSGRDCDLLQIDRQVDRPDGGTTTLDAKWAFDTVSHLPVQYESSFGKKTVSALKVNPGFDMSALKLGGTEVSPADLFAKDLLAVGEDAPKFRLKDPAGHDHSLDDYSGKLLLLDFWGTWCVPCRKAMPALQSLHQKYKGKGLNVIGIAVADNAGDPPGFMKKHGFTYSLLLSGDRVAQQFKAKVLPTVYLIDGKGKILYRESGYREQTKAELDALIQKHLEG